MGNCIGKIYPFDDCDSCQEHCCDICSKKLLLMGSALSKYEKRLDNIEAAGEEADIKLQENLDAEINRATEAEAQLDAKIDKEIQDRINDVNDEENRATQAENQLRNDLNDEVSRATTKENELNEAINKEIADREAAIAELEETTSANLEVAKQELQTNIDNEVTRAKAAEQTLQSNINKEVQDRIADVNAEETRATEAEQLLTTNLNSEITRAKAAEEKLTTDLNAEKTRAEAAEQELDEKITVETTRATEAEETLQANIDAEEERATQAETTLTTNLNKEIQDRTNADEALKTNIENGTIVANKATNDSDGNPINTTYVKVEGFKTNYLDSNNVMYKDDVEVLEDTDGGNNPLSGLSIKGVNYNIVSSGRRGNKLNETLWTIAASAFPDSYSSWNISASGGLGVNCKHSLLLSGGFRDTTSSDTSICYSTIIDPYFTTGSNYLSEIDHSLLIGNITSNCHFTTAGNASPNTGFYKSVVLCPLFNAEIDEPYVAGGAHNSVFIGTIPENGGYIATIKQLFGSVIIGCPSYEENLNWDGAVLIGSSAVARDQDSIAIGNAAKALSKYDVVIGRSSSTVPRRDESGSIVADSNTLIGGNNSMLSPASYIIALGFGSKSLDLSNAMYIDGLNENRTFILTDTSKILFRNGDITRETTSLNDFPNRKTLQQYLNEKQDTLTAGEGISITDNTISCTAASPVTATDVVIDLK